MDMKVIVASILTIVLGMSSIVIPRSSAEPLPAKGSLTGIVCDAETGDPLGHAIVIVAVDGTSLAGASLQDGSFTIPDIPVGAVSLKIIRLGYRPQRTDSVLVRPGEPTKLSIALVKIWPERESEQRRVVGTAVDVSADDLRCEVLPLKDCFHVGDKPRFKVVIRNMSQKTFFLVGAIDNSEAQSRYPYVTLEIEGPEDGIARPQPAECGYENALRLRDFAEVSPGGTFEPITPPFWAPRDAHHAKFAKPGRYQVTFHYSSNEIDYALWVGQSSWDYVSGSVVDKLKQVPRIEIWCTTTIEVHE